MTFLLWNVYKIIVLYFLVGYAGINVEADINGVIFCSHH